MVKANFLVLPILAAALQLHAQTCAPANPKPAPKTAIVAKSKSSGGSAAAKKKATAAKKPATPAIVAKPTSVATPASPAKPAAPPPPQYQTIELTGTGWFRNNQLSIAQQSAREAAEAEARTACEINRGEVMGVSSTTQSGIPKCSPSAKPPYNWYADATATCRIKK